ncbi:hypothetical protein [Streptomyces sp. NPDC004589]|uniref:Rv1733c family protein n=1 Tax=unclassified Streptomyces TaxID=2593676 RepID=UPI0033A74BCD
MRAISGLWRWRGNPLRRGTDLAEAWTALAALLLVLVAAPLAGAVIGSVAQESLQKAVRDQQHSRHLVVATVARKLNRVAPDPDPESSTTGNAHSRVVADWTAPDGTRRHAAVLTELESPHPGDHFSVWTDTHGGLVTRPLDRATATTHAVLAGATTAGLTGVLIEGGRRLIVWRMVRRRYTRWDQAWDKAGPDWGRTGTGS